jgi:hypothetical protein
MRVEELLTEDQDELFELIRKRRIEQRRIEQILANAQIALKAVDEGTVKRGNFEDVKSYLLEVNEVY